MYILQMLVLGSCLLLGYGPKAASNDDYIIPETVEESRAVQMLHDVVRDNNRFVRETGEQHFQAFTKSQNPRMTLVSCADSRVHTKAFDLTPENDIFTVRNLSGQYDAGKAAIKYGVFVAGGGTEILLFLGHDDCGAVKVATEIEHNSDEKKKYDTDIVAELEHVFVARGAPKTDSDFDRIVHHNVKHNIHCQIDKCLEAPYPKKTQSDETPKGFFDRVTEGRLVVVGALYDFANTEGQGFGHLKIIDVRDKKWAEEWAEAKPPMTSQKGTVYRIHKKVQEAIERMLPRVSAQ